MPTLAPESLHDFSTALLEGLEAPPAYATAVGASLVAADLRGHASHGVRRIPRYGRMIADGAIDPEAEPSVETDGPTGMVDGRNAFGQIVGRRAVEALEAAVDEIGIAAVGVRRASHLGRVGEWAERAADRGLVFAAFVNTGSGSATVAAPGTANRILSTNPVAIGVPTYDVLPYPVVLDVATSQVANGKVRDRAARGERLPDGWAITSEGEPLRDPAAFMQGSGASLPLGGLTSGHKGFGLGVIAELLAGFVGDAPVAGQRDADWSSNAAAFIAFDPTRFSSLTAIRNRIDTLSNHVGSATPGPVPMPPGAASDVGRLPGAPEYYAALDGLADGIALPDRVADALVDIANETDRAAAVPDALL